MTGLQLKKFFKTQFGMPVLASASKHWCSVRIKPEPRPTRTTTVLGKEITVENVLAPLIYKHSFPVELRQRCLRIVYPNNPGLQAQTSAGNIESHSLAMHHREWEALVAQYGVAAAP